MFTMAKRNIKLYFRDKSSVFFSLMGVLVIIVLNIFFLTENLTDAFGDVPNIKELVGTWLVAGIVAVATTTTALGALGTMIEDKSRKIYKDFYTSPLKRGSLAGGYILSCMVVGVIMSVISLAVGLVYIVSLGGSVPSGETLAKAVGIIVLAVLANGSFMFFVAHYMEEATQADYVTIMSKGEIIAQGTPIELKEKYSSDMLKMKYTDKSALTEKLRAMGAEYIEDVETVNVKLDDTMQAIPIIEECKDWFVNFEVVNGTMDDAFLNATGTNLE